MPKIAIFLEDAKNVCLQSLSSQQANETSIQIHLNLCHDPKPMVLLFLDHHYLETTNLDRWNHDILLAAQGEQKQ